MFGLLVETARAEAHTENGAEKKGRTRGLSGSTRVDFRALLTGSGVGAAFVAAHMARRAQAGTHEARFAYVMIATLSVSSIEYQLASL